MEYRQMGKSGVRVSSVGLGTNQFGGKVEQRTVDDIIDRALDVGVNFIDTADVYQGGRSEEFLGRALKGRRHQVVLATKVYMKVGEGPNDRGSSRYHIINGLEASLRRLQTDHIDLYQMHRWDATTPIEETLRTLDDQITAGRIRYVGASAFAAWQLAKANLLAEVRGWAQFVTVQSHYHMFERGVEREVLPFCQADGVGFIPYFPLAGGFLTGKYRQGQSAPPGTRGENSAYVQQYMSEAGYRAVEALTSWAEQRERSSTELAIAWLLAQPQVCTVIAGVTRLAQLEQNVKAADWVLSAAEMEDVNGILEETA